MPKSSIFREILVSFFLKDGLISFKHLRCNLQDLNGTGDQITACGHVSMILGLTHLIFQPRLRRTTQPRQRRFASSFKKVVFPALPISSYGLFGISHNDRPTASMIYCITISSRVSLIFTFVLSPLFRFYPATFSLVLSQNKVRLRKDIIWN